MRNQFYFIPQFDFFEHRNYRDHFDSDIVQMFVEIYYIVKPYRRRKVKDKHGGIKFRCSALDEDKETHVTAVCSCSKTVYYTHFARAHTHTNL